MVAELDKPLTPYQTEFAQAARPARVQSPTWERMAGASFLAALFCVAGVCATSYAAEHTDISPQLIWWGTALTGFVSTVSYGMKDMDLG
jgi:hypothetical protein